MRANPGVSQFVLIDVILIAAIIAGGLAATPNVLSVLYPHIRKEDHHCDFVPDNISIIAGMICLGAGHASPQRK